MRRLLSLRPGTRKLLIEACLYLGWARILKAMPFSRITPLLGNPMIETPHVRDLENEKMLLQISRAILTASRYVWWESKCLVMAIAAMKMLQRRRIASTLYLGTAKEPSGKMVAHAWLRSGTFVVTGAEGMERYTVVAKFGGRITDHQRSASSL